jgi:precorrin-6A/cobalt-precorrin-6A reductase
VLVLGGTAEAREIATALEDAGIRAVMSLAGRVQHPDVPVGEARVGGFGGTDGLATWLNEHGCEAVIDATHPFATQISRSAAIACASTGIPLVRLNRPGWKQQPTDRWHWVNDIHGAAALVSTLGARVLLTIGRQRLEAFAAIPDVWFLIRSIDPPAGRLPARHEVVLSRGPFTADGERALMLQHQIDLLVTRDSGGASTEAKLIAARELGIPVIIIRRPSLPGASTVECASQAVEWARGLVPLDGA